MPSFQPLLQVSASRRRSLPTRPTMSSSTSCAPQTHITPTTASRHAYLTYCSPDAVPLCWGLQAFMPEVPEQHQGSKKRAQKTWSHGRSRSLRVRLAGMEPRLSARRSRRSRQQRSQPQPRRWTRRLPPPLPSRWRPRSPTSTPCAHSSFPAFAHARLCRSLDWLSLHEQGGTHVELSAPPRLRVTKKEISGLAACCITQHAA